VQNIQATAFRSLFRNRNDKSVNISLDTGKVYNDMFPNEDIVFKERTTKLSLSMVQDTKIGKLERQRDQIFAMLTCNTVIGNPVSTLYPYSNLLHLHLEVLPIDSDHLVTLKQACPKLQTLELVGLQLELVELFTHFTMVSFPEHWPSIKKVSFKHAYVTSTCLRQIAHCSEWMEDYHRSIQR